MKANYFELLKRLICVIFSIRLKEKQNRQLYRDIVNDKVDLSEYNVLCRIGNALHYVQEILGISRHQVLWRDSIIG